MRRMSGKDRQLLFLVAIDLCGAVFIGAVFVVSGENTLAILLSGLFVFVAKWVGRKALRKMMKRRRG